MRGSVLGVECHGCSDCGEYCLPDECSRCHPKKEKPVNKFKEAEKLKKEYRATLRAITAEDVKSLFDGLFEKYPNFRAIGWKQYVPSFNDGEPCEFTMDTDFQVLTNQAIKDNLEGLDESGTMTDDEIHQLGVRDFGWSKLDPEMENDISDVFSLISSDISEMVFGADVQIIITRTKLTANSYECGY